MKHTLILRRPALTDEATFHRALASWDNSPGFLFAQGHQPGMAYADYIRLMADWEAGRNLPTGFVPTTTLMAFIGDEIVGRVGLRHSLNDFLLRLGGHIGYGVLPTHRRKGYAKEMLRQALPIAKSVGITRALVTCDDTNVGSARTIEANGGVLENKVEAGPGLPLKRRYWIQL